MTKRACIFSLFLVLNPLLFSQSDPIILNLEMALEMATRNHHSISVSEADLRLAELESRQYQSLPPMAVLFERGQLYTYRNDYNFEIMQSFGPVNTYSVRKKLGGKNIEQKQLMLDIELNKIEMQVKQIWNQLIYLREIYSLKNELLSYYSERERIAELQEKAGEISMMAMISIRTQNARMKSELYDSKAAIAKAERELMQLIDYENEIHIPGRSLEMYTIQFPTDRIKDFSGNNKKSELYSLEAEISDMNVLLARKRTLPEISAGYFQRSIGGMKGMRGFQVGIGIPLWFLPGYNEQERSMILSEIRYHELENVKKEQSGSIEELIFSLDQTYGKLRFYDQDALRSADLLEKTIVLQSEMEDIEFEEVFNAMVNISEIRQSYLETLNEYNKTAIQLEYYVK